MITKSITLITALVCSAILLSPIEAMEFKESLVSTPLKKEPNHKSKEQLTPTNPYPIPSLILNLDQPNAQNLTKVKVAIIDGLFIYEQAPFLDNLSVYTKETARQHTHKKAYKTAYQTLYNHGTSIANQIGGRRGVAPNAELTLLSTIKRLDDLAQCEELKNKRIDHSNWTLASLIIEAMQNNVDFINISRHLANPDNHNKKISRVVKKALTLAANAGIGIIVSAGNESETIGDTPYTQSLLELAQELNGSLVLVGNTQYSKTSEQGIKESLNPTSNKAGLASLYFVCAPGTNLKLFGPEDKVRRHCSGTSYAAPFVTGAAALLKGMFPTLSNQKILNALLFSARNKALHDAKAILPDNQYGNGVVDFKEAVEYAQILTDEINKNI
jgi:subtilisin family serine protease